MIFIHRYIILFLFYCVEPSDENPLWAELSKLILFLYFTPEENNSSELLI